MCTFCLRRYYVSVPTCGDLYSDGGGIPLLSTISLVLAVPSRAGNISFANRGVSVNVYLFGVSSVRQTVNLYI